MRARHIAAAAVAAAGLAAGAAPALGATGTTGVSVNVTVPTITITAPASLNFGNLAAGANGFLEATVTVESSAPAGYALTAQRTAFSNGDLNLDITSAAGPSGTTSAIATAADPTAIPVASGPGGASLLIGRRIGSVSQSGGGDPWTLAVGLGVPLAASAGSHTSTVTFTALGL